MIVFYGGYKMKKFVALLLALVMVLSLAACGSKTADTDQPTDDGDSAGIHHRQQRCPDHGHQCNLPSL